jgi:hypothetical protein
LAFSSRQRSKRAAELEKKLSTFVRLLVEDAMVFAPDLYTRISLAALAGVVDSQVGSGAAC